MVSSLFFVFLLFCLRFFFFFFFFNDTATTEIYTLSLHDALPIFRARDRGIGGITLEWVLFGDGPGPQKEGLARLETDREAFPTPGEEPQGRVPAAIAEALQADLSHNEFGQWSSIEVQRTVLWGLKDLARRLRTLHFDMGKTFELTDEWAGNIGLPVRSAEQSSEEPG